jgi:ABC-type transport auxiliary lipoprotein component
VSAARLAVLVVAAQLVACSSPNPVLYTIAPVQGPVQPGGPKVIVLQQISTAHYLERSQIVRSSENYRLDVMSNDWWGEPLGAMLSRVALPPCDPALRGGGPGPQRGSATACSGLPFILKPLLLLRAIGLVGQRSHARMVHRPWFRRSCALLSSSSRSGRDHPIPYFALIYPGRRICSRTVLDPAIVVAFQGRERETEPRHRLTPVQAELCSLLRASH